MKNKKEITTVLVSVLVTLAVVFGTFLGIKLIKNSLAQSDQNDTSESDDPNVGDVNSDGNDKHNPANPDAISVSMLQLITTPEKYDGKLVRVIGVGNIEFEGNCISLSKEDWKYMAGNCIWLELSELATPYEEAVKYNGEYVIVEGIFDKDDRGHMGLFHGAIKQVSRYQLWKSHRETAE
ncbi:MAG: hypothetical protein E7625_06665 [Ruminococcaceae bacterium]|nr:hypothetical protein [Oscillospiraceae bacterium]